MSELRIEIFPSDLDATVDFYRDVLGFELLRDERVTDIPYVSLQRGRVRLGAAGRPFVDPSLRRPPSGVELVLEVDDVDAMLARVVGAGGALDEGLTDRPWGLRDFRLVDPSGYYWRVTEPEE
jgi:lactoylglutathione lyase